MEDLLSFSSFYWLTFSWWLRYFSFNFGALKSTYGLSSKPSVLGISKKGIFSLSSLKPPLVNLPNGLKLSLSNWRIFAQSSAVPDYDYAIKYVLKFSFKIERNCMWISMSVFISEFEIKSFSSEMFSEFFKMSFETERDGCEKVGIHLFVIK